MKNDIVITGILLSVDQYLNVKLNLVSVVNKEAHPQLGKLQYSGYDVVCLIFNTLS